MIEILSGIVTGIGMALLGYLKSAKKEKFNELKFLKTVIIGAVVGVIFTLYNVDFSTANAWLESSGAVIIIDYITKIIYRKLK